jgi:hypothetical protein
VELKETVWHGTKDLVIHQTAAHGTGAGEFRLSIYLVWSSGLYKVLDVFESAYRGASAGEVATAAVWAANRHSAVIVKRTYVRCMKDLSTSRP